MQLNKKGRSLLGLAAMLIGFLFIILLKAQGVAGYQTVSQENALPSLIQTEQENQQLSADNEKLRLELLKYAQGQNASDLANQQLQAAKMNAGLMALTGPGVKVTLDDAQQIPKESLDLRFYYIHEEYIREILNALWNGGAEAIAVNGQRVTTNTEVFCSGSYIQINGTRQMPPYVIQAIGDTGKLSGALKFFGWDILGDLQLQFGITRKAEILDKVTIPAGKEIDYKYAEPVKEGT